MSVRTAICEQLLPDRSGSCDGDIDDTGYCSRCGVRAEPPELPPTTPNRSAAINHGRRSTPIATHHRSSPVYGREHYQLPISLDEDDDPREALLVDPALPERKRTCRNPKCYQGRTEKGRPRLVEGFCRSCGWGYSFRPPLRPEMIVAERYEVLGAIGRGGLGWVYLAVDLRIGKYVVLKGLLNTDNPEHHRVAHDELRVLAGTDHPNIVAVHDTVRHRYVLPYPGGEVDIDYIVMDYIRGRSLLQLYRERRDQGEYLSIIEAGESVLQALRAVSYLHRMTPQGLLYNDFSPDNLMRNKAGRTWLIDLGGVSLLDDAESGGWGKDGYRDPYDNPPSPQTDIYAVGRTLALLTMRVPGFGDGKSLPGPDTEPLLARHESFHLLLQRATHPDPRHAVRLGRRDGRPAGGGAARGPRGAATAALPRPVQRVRARGHGGRGRARRVPGDPHRLDRLGAGPARHPGRSDRPLRRPAGLAERRRPAPAAAGARVAARRHPGDAAAGGTGPAGTAGRTPGGRKPGGGGPVSGRRSDRG